MSHARAAWILFTDLDGTLLDPATYAWQAAQPALDALAIAGIPVILNSSKTRAEIEALRHEMRHDGPFIVENGAALFAPAHKAGAFAHARLEGAYRVITWGTPYARIVSALASAARTAGVIVRGFHDMDDAEVAERCGLPIADVQRAKQREFDEPFVMVGGGAGAIERLEAAVDAMGLRLTRGDRFHHLLGRHDKALAARATVSLYKLMHDTVRTIALGDALNDLEMLRDGDVSIIVGSPYAAALGAAVPTARRAAAGPEGWNAAVLQVLEEIGTGA